MTHNVAPTRDLPRTASTSAAPGTAAPGWPEFGVGIAAYAILIGAGILVIVSMPDEQSVARGIVSYAVSALAGIGAFAAAVAVRIRGLHAFGIRRVAGKWLLLGAGLGLGAYLLNILVAVGYVTVTGDATTPQGDYSAAASGGALAFVLAILFGAIATPIGEEFLFRGVLANALGRYGAWVGVIGSSAIFALAHGVNIILPIAFVVGITAALLLRKTGSIWPGVFVHGVNNATAVLVPAVISLMS